MRTLLLQDSWGVDCMLFHSAAFQNRNVASGTIHLFHSLCPLRRIKGHCVEPWFHLPLQSISSDIFAREQERGGGEIGNKNTPKTHHFTIFIMNRQRTGSLQAEQLPFESNLGEKLFCLRSLKMTSFLPPNYCSLHQLKQLSQQEVFPKPHSVMLTCICYLCKVYMQYLLCQVFNIYCSNRIVID